MKPIDTKQWKEFAIKDLFTVKRPLARSQANYDDGTVAFVASGNINNGVLKYLEPKQNESLDAGNCITVSPIDGSSFYQAEDFLGRGGAGSSVILLYNPNLNRYNGHFIATVIRTVCRKYAYSDMANKDTIGAEKIKIPVDKKGDPDFLYMETYIKNRELAVKSSLTNLMIATSIFESPIDTSKWGAFPIGKLFDVVKGSRLTKADMREGTIRYVGASSFNNGITTYISNDEHLHPANTLTVCYNGSDIGRTFYQTEPYWATDDVNVLYPKFEMNENIALFFAPIIKCVGGLHEYDDKWKLEDMKQDIIKLPIKPDGTPDFAYMVSYIQKTRTVAMDRISILQSL